MLAEPESQSLFQRVAREHHARAGFGQAARDHGAAFPGGGVAAALVEGAELFQLTGPGLWKLGEQRSAHAG